jgi:hypothetical protein
LLSTYVDVVAANVVANVFVVAIVADVSHVVDVVVVVAVVANGAAYVVEFLLCKEVLPFVPPSALSLYL